MADQNSSPPTSPASSPSAKGTRTPLSPELSALPPLIHPSPPSNTLLITNLLEPSTFHPTHLSTIRTLISQIAPLHSFSPLKSLRRIIVSFYDIDSAIQIRQLLDNEPIMGHLARVYFGEPTPIEPIDQHLHAPKSQKMFFISPPPSPPFGWEMRNEGPPNKDVIAGDLAMALANLHARPSGPNDNDNSNDDPISPVSIREGDGVEREGKRVANRQRSGSSTVVYHPQDHGDSPHLPAVMVEDTTERSEEMEDIKELDTGGPIMAHTARPPVELMMDL